MTVATIDDAKAQAKDLRLALAAKGMKVSHSQALELIAQQNGAADWNTLRSRLPPPDADPFHAGQRISGTYLGRPFSGRITELSPVGRGYRVTIAFDQPVDVVTFDSFSNLRNQIRGTVGRAGRSDTVSSNGEPTLVITPM
ncbi:MAG: glyoxalase superfamily protein [Mesorhizobium sp.]